MRNPRLQLIGLILAGLCLWGISLGVRRVVLSQQTRESPDRETPFILEAALQYRMTRLVYETGRLPTHEPKVQYPEGINPWKTYSIGAEFLYSALARLLPSDMSLVSRLRWVSTALFCFAVPLVAFWSGLLWKSRAAGVLTGLILAVSPAFVVRSTGLALSRENLAIPFIALFLATELLARRTPHPRKRLLWILVCGLAAGMAQVTWDLSQFVLTLWALWVWVGLARGKAGETDRNLVLSVTCGLLLATVLHPYLRVQGFLFSPCLSLLFARCFVEIPLVRGKTPRLALPVVAVVFLLGWGAIGRNFIENYSHFNELLIAKIQHGNVKPHDPSLLTYAQRIMWTPALNSSTWGLTIRFFSGTLFGLILAGLVLGGKKKALPDHSGFLFFMLATTLPLYALFFRLHVFLIVFAATAIGGAVSMLFKGSSLWPNRLLPLAFSLFLIGFESHRLLFFEPPIQTRSNRDTQLVLDILRQQGFDVPNTPVQVDRSRLNRWGAPGQSVELLRDLADVMRRLEEPGPILTSFGLSAFLLTETDMPILLHPKFETPGIRERVRAFYEHLFLEDEESFRDWALSLGARWYVHRHGALDENVSDPTLLGRYMVDAMKPPESAAVRALEFPGLTPPRFFAPEAMVLRQDGRPFYTVYRVLRPGERDPAITRFAGWIESHSTPERPVRLVTNFDPVSLGLNPRRVQVLLAGSYDAPEDPTRIREFLQALYLKDETAFRAWALELGATHYLHRHAPRGTLLDPAIPRFVVDPAAIPSDALGRLVETSPRETFWLVFHDHTLYRPHEDHPERKRVYTLYRIVSEDDLDRAAEFTDMAIREAMKENFQNAKRLLWTVLEDYHWKFPAALELLEQIGGVLPPSP